ncbi:hypothetical protein [Burkholderia stagnalis]
MQKHEVLLLQIVSVVASLLVGLWVSFALAGHPGFLSGLAAVQDNVLLLWGLLPGIALAVFLVKACREYLFNGFEGYRYERFIRGVRMENWHLLGNRIRRHNRKLVLAERRQRKRAAAQRRRPPKSGDSGQSSVERTRPQEMPVRENS